MMNKSTLALAILGSALIFSGCSKDKKEEPKKPVAEQKQDKPKKEKAKKKETQRLAALSPDFPRTRMGDIPTSAELEEEAGKSIALENLEAELDRLEAEIASEE